MSATLTKPYRSNPYREQGWHLFELLRQREWWQWQLVSIDDGCESPSQAESSRAFILAELADLNAEIGRRERYRNHPDAPPWPALGGDLKPFWETIKARVTVLDFYEAASLGILRKSGTTWRGPCPLCVQRDPDTETRPALSIFADNRAWHCFRCLEGGDVFSLAAHIWLDMNFPEVAFSLADLFGIERPINGSFPPACIGVREGRNHFQQPKPERYIYVGGKVMSNG